MNASRAKRATSVVIGLVAMIGTVVGTTSTAAQAAAVTTSFQNVGTGNWLDSNGAGEVYSIPGNGSRNQDWELTWDSPTTIKNVGTGRCLDHNVALGRVTTSPCNGGNRYQRWHLHRDGSIQNDVSGQCLDDNRALGRLVAAPCDRANAFRVWRQAA